MAAMKLSDERDNLIQNLIWAILTALGAAALPLIKTHWHSWSEPTLYALLGASWVAVVYTTLTGKRPFSGPGTTPRNVERRVKSWLDKYGFGMKSVRDDSAYFNIEVTFANGKHVTVVRQKADSRYLGFVCVLRVEGEFLEKLTAMPEDAYNRTILEFTLELLRAKIAYVRKTEPSFQVELSRKVPITAGLDADLFIGVVYDMNFASNLALTAISLAIDRNSARPVAASLAAATAAGAPS
jgi:hypothetical protein